MMSFRVCLVRKKAGTKQEQDQKSMSVKKQFIQIFGKLSKNIFFMI